MRLIDADALIEDVTKRFCEDCDRRKGVKNGREEFVYEIGGPPCRACDIDDMKIELEYAPTMQEMKWVPVDERLPNDWESVIVSLESENLLDTQICYMYKGEWRNSCTGLKAPAFGYRITAWMPLPKTYNPDKGQQDMLKREGP